MSCIYFPTHQIINKADYRIIKILDVWESMLPFFEMGEMGKGTGMGTGRGRGGTGRGMSRWVGGWVDG